MFGVGFEMAPTEDGLVRSFVWHDKILSTSWLTRSHALPSRPAPSLAFGSRLFSFAARTRLLRYSRHGASDRGAAAVSTWSIERVRRRRRWWRQPPRRARGPRVEVATGHGRELVGRWRRWNGIGDGDGDGRRAWWPGYDRRGWNFELGGARRGRWPRARLRRGRWGYGRCHRARRCWKRRVRWARRQASLKLRAVAADDGQRADEARSGFTSSCVDGLWSAATARAIAQLVCSQLGWERSAAWYVIACAERADHRRADLLASPVRILAIQEEELLQHITNVSGARPSWYSSALTDLP